MNSWGSSDIGGASAGGGAGVSSRARRREKVVL